MGYARGEDGRAFPIYMADEVMADVNVDRNLQNRLPHHAYLGHVLVTFFFGRKSRQLTKTEEKRNN